MILYKYLPSKIGIKVLTNSSIRFTQPAALNDPFESLWIFDEDSLNETLKATESMYKVEFGRPMSDNERLELPFLVEREVLNLPKEFSKVIGLLSLSKENNVSLMWSHYANEHKGLVIGFDSELFQAESQYTELTEVEYSKVRPIYSSSKDEKAGWKQLEKLLFTKSINWQYEKEFRSIVRLEYSEAPFKLPNSEYLCHLFKFPSESIKEVIFGWHTPSNKREEIQKLVTKNLPEVKLFEAKPCKLSFDLDIFPFK